MRPLRFLAWLLAALATAVLGIWIAQDNSAQTAVVVLGFSLGSLPLGIWLMLAFLAGVLASLLASAPGMVGLRLRVRRLQKRQGAQQEIPAPQTGQHAEGAQIP